jgi:hypothetical protein
MHLHSGLARSLHDIAQITLSTFHIKNIFLQYMLAASAINLAKWAS